MDALLAEGRACVAAVSALRRIAHVATVQPLTPAERTEVRQLAEAVSAWRTSILVDIIEVLTRDGHDADAVRAALGDSPYPIGAVQ